jgi:cephalosporin-C deacetylase-like acetyl esterase
VGVDVRGYGNSKHAAPDRAPSGYILTGSEAPETHILRGAVCDYMRAVEVAGDLLGAPAPRTVLHGFSFAGALAVMAEAQLQAADLLVLGVPSLGWAEGRRFFVTGGSGSEVNRYLDDGPEAHDEEDLMLVFRYFDSMNFADRIRCATLVGVGEVDHVVPAPTVRAIASHLGGPSEVMSFPVSHSQSPEERRWDEFEARWLRLAVDGVPQGFGTYRAPSA